jgi:hypothetical protein
LVLGIVAAIILPIVLKVDYEETHNRAKDLSLALGDLTSQDSCAGLVSYVDSTYTTGDVYGKYVDNCKGAIADVRTYTDAVSGTSGLRDGELRELWDAYKTSYERLMPVYDQLVDTYPAWHEFVVKREALQKASDWYKTVTEAKLEAMVKPLEDSGVEAFKAYAEGLKSKYIPYVMAYKKRDLAYTTWTNTSLGSPNKNATRDAYYEARDEMEALQSAWNQWKGDNSVDLSTEELLGVDLDASDNNLKNIFNKFYNDLYSKYLDNAVKEMFGV